MGAANQQLQNALVAAQNQPVAEVTETEVIVPDPDIAPVSYTHLKKLTGDSLFYDRILGYGEAFDNVQMNDPVSSL